MSRATSRAYRSRRKRTDPLPILLAVLSLIGLPVLGFAAYKLYNRPPTVIITEEHIEVEPTGPAKSSSSQPADAKVASATPVKAAPAAMSTPRFEDSKFGPDANSGGAGDRVTSVAGAMDHIAGQLTEAIGELHKKVLIVWLLDQSSSNQHARLDVAGRLDVLYSKLAAAEQKPADGKKPDDQDAQILSVVAAYGPEVEFVTAEPTANAAAVKKAAQDVKSNSSHIENTFAAVQAVVQRFSSYRLKGRFVSLIVVSDEAGDDEQKIDQLLPTLKRYTIPVYCIGVEATFASPGGSNQMAEGSGANKQEIRVRQGPDSRFPEWIHLQYPDGRNDAGFSIDTELGPYTMARLCQQTDGEYFALPQIGGGYGMSSYGMSDGGYGKSAKGRGKRETMQSSGSYSGTLPKKYAPIYLPELELQAQLEKNKAKKALVEASLLPEAAVLTNPQTRFSNDDDVQRTRALEAAQKPAARLKPEIDALYNALKAGEADEPKLAGEPRWQVAYDLAFGRASAAKARAESYMSQLAQMKSGRKFTNPKSTQWVLEQTNDPTGESAADKPAKKSRELLDRIIKDHPNTPWAKSAEMELEGAMGWKWVER